jgi:hypothetical protein
MAERLAEGGTADPNDIPVDSLDNLDDEIIEGMRRDATEEADALTGTPLDEARADQAVPPDMEPPIVEEVAPVVGEPVEFARPELDTQAFIDEEAERIRQGFRQTQREIQEHLEDVTYVELRSRRLAWGKWLSQRTAEVTGRLRQLSDEAVALKSKVDELLLAAEDVADPVASKAAVEELVQHQMAVNHLTQQVVDLGNMREGFRRFFLDSFPGPLNFQGWMRARAWDMYDEYMSGLYKAIGEIEDELFNMPVEELAGRVDEGFSARELFERFGGKLEFEDGELVSFWMPGMQEWRGGAYRGTIVELEDLIGVRGEEGWGVPFRARRPAEVAEDLLPEERLRQQVDESMRASDEPRTRPVGGRDFGR